MISPGVFFLFIFEFFIFGTVRGVKGQEIAQNEKQQLHSSHTISQEQYSLWSWVLVLMYKMIISPGVQFFQTFDFLG